MRILFFSCFLLASTVAIGQQKVYYTSGKFLNKIPRASEGKVTFSYKLFAKMNGTFGYDIFANDIILFHQQDMPGKQDGIGFSSKEDAEKVAKRIILKLERPIERPVVSTNEFKLLHIQ